MLKAILLLTLPLLACSQLVPPRVLIVAFDGMRWDYINPDSTPFIWSLGQKGVFATQGISNQMFTITMGNFYSISTGLYQENHGIIGNFFYDPDFKAYYDYWDFLQIPSVTQDSRNGRWYSGEPIWQTNEKMGSNYVSGAMRWPGCDANINNITMRYCAPFDGYFGYDKWKQDIDQLVGWFVQPGPINLGLYYNPYPDEVEHAGDIYRPEVRDTLRQLDNLTAYLFDQLKSNNLLDNINVILMADHGFTNTYKEFEMLLLEDIAGVGFDDVFISQNSIFPNPANNITADQLYERAMKFRNQQPNIDVYRKEDLPDDWHYKNNKRVGPVVVVEKLGFRITAKPFLPTFPNASVFGSHGYAKSYPEMRPFFVATGPAFKSGFNITSPEQVQNVDVYPLMAHLLGISSNAPQVDGKFDKIQFILKCEPNCQGNAGSTTTTTTMASTTTSPDKSSGSYSLPSAVVAVLLLAHLIV